MSGTIHIYNHRLQVRLQAGWLFAIDDEVSSKEDKQNVQVMRVLVSVIRERDE
jgi:hypothetical protein